MRKTTLASLLLVAMCSACTVAGNWPSQPPARVPSPLPTERIASSFVEPTRLTVPVQIVHVTIRHNGDRLIRLAARGTIEAHDGVLAVWNGETVQRNLRAPTPPGIRARHYTVSTDVVRVDETVAVMWDADQHMAHLRVTTKGSSLADDRVLAVRTVPAANGQATEHLDANGPIVLGVQVAPSVPASDRREVDVVVVGGSERSGVDEVLVWNAARRAYDTLPTASGDAF